MDTPDTMPGAPPGPVSAMPTPVGAPPAAAPPERKGWAVSESEANAIAGLPPTPQSAPQTEAQAPQKPPALDVAAAAFRENNVLSAAVDRWMNHPDANVPDVPGYSAYDNNGIAGYEGYSHQFVDSTSPQQTQVIKERINAEQADKQTIALAGGAGVATSMAAGVVDPISLTLMMIPGLGEIGAASRVGRIGAIVGTNIAAGEVQQAALTGLKETTNYTDNMLPRIGANALLAGVLGTLATRMPKAEFAALADKADAAINPIVPAESTAGAMHVQDTTLGQESFSSAGNWIAKADAALPHWLASPTMRIMSSSPVVESRRLVQRLVDLGGGALNKNFEGIKTADNVEMISKQIVQTRMAQIMRTFDEQFADYAKTAGPNALSKYDFGAEIGKAGSNGDVHEIPQVAAVAKAVRPFLDADHEMLTKIAPDADYAMLQKTAKSYWPRVWDNNKITGDRTNFEETLFNHFTKNPKMEAPEPAKVKGEAEPKAGAAVEEPKPIFREPGEVKAAVQDSIDNIQHAVRGTADIGTGVRNPKSMKARALDLPDNTARPWLSDDFEGTMHAYMNSMVPHIEMHRQFGSADLATEFQQISDAYRVKMAAAGSNNAAKATLVKQRESDIADLALMRDRALGQAGPRNNESLAIVRVAQFARSVNYIRSLGAQLFSALPDYGRVVAQYGLTNTMSRTAQFITNSELRNLSKADMQRYGTALDVLLHTREHSLDGTGPMVNTGDWLNKKMGNLTGNFTKWSLIAHWDQNIRLLTATLEQDKIGRLLRGENMSALDKARLAAHGIGDEDLPGLRAQWLKHGDNDIGVDRARTELWDKTAGAQAAKQTFEQAIQRAASSNAFFIGKGDMPPSADTQLGKFMFQFKGFVMGSVERLVLPLAQGIAAHDVKAANGLGAMLALGGMTYYLKQLAAGRPPDMSPSNLARESLSASGVLAFLPDVYDPIAGLAHLPRMSKFKDHSWEETLGGPTLGEADILGHVVGRTLGGHMTYQDLHKFRQLFPWQNIFYANRGFNMLEGETADAFNLQNAPHRPAIDYFNPAKDQASRPFPEDKEHLFGIKSIPNSF